MPKLNILLFSVIPIKNIKIPIIPNITPPAERCSIPLKAITPINIPKPISTNGKIKASFKVYPFLFS